MNSNCGFGKVCLSLVEKANETPSINKFGIPYDSRLFFKLEVFWVNATSRLKNTLAFLGNFLQTFFKGE